MAAMMPKRSDRAKYCTLNSKTARMIIANRGGPMSQAQPRTSVKLSESVHRQLNLYALAASAAGVGLLSVPSACAEIVYTPTHVKMDVVHGFYPIDFNNDGTFDLGIWFPASCSSNGCAADLFAYPNS